MVRSLLIESPARAKPRADQTMKTCQTLFSILALTAVTLSSGFAGDVAAPATAPVETKEPNALDLFSLDWDYTTRSDFADHNFGSQDEMHSDFNYSHRFPIKGQVYFRTGIEYERFDFGGTTRGGAPDKLQALSGVFALEYVEENFAGAAIEFHPGFYFQNDIRGSSFDMPIDLYTTFKINDKFYVMIGAAAALNYHPNAFPIGGVIWLISDKVRLEGIFPKPALVWNPSDNWEFRAGGEILGGAYRLDSNYSDPKLAGAVVQYSETRVGVQAGYSGFKHFQLIAGAGYTLSRDFDFYRATGERHLDGAFYCKFGLEAKF
jgi:hypothetical protein